MDLQEDNDEIEDVIAEDDEVMEMDEIEEEANLEVEIDAKEESEAVAEAEVDADVDDVEAQVPIERTEHLVGGRLKLSLSLHRTQLSRTVDREGGSEDQDEEYDEAGVEGEQELLVEEAYGEDEEAEVGEDEEEHERDNEDDNEEEEEDEEVMTFP